MGQSLLIIQSVDRALKILNILAEAGERGLALSQVSQRVELNASTARHLLTTLIHNRYVEQEPVSKRYRLGFHMIELGNAARAATSLTGITRSYVDRLAETTNQTTTFIVFQDLRRAALSQARRRLTLSAQNAPHELSTLHCTSSGKLLLANLPPAQLDDYLQRSPLERFTKATITDPAALKQELARALAAGMALESEEYALGVCSIAVPVYDANNRVLGCLDMVFPNIGLSEQSLAGWQALFAGSGRELSDQLRAGAMH